MSEIQLEAQKVWPTKPLVKLLTLWMWDKEYSGGVKQKPHEHIISFGIWEALSVEVNGEYRVYTLRCVLPMHENLKFGEIRRMDETILLLLCHRVTIEHHAKEAADEFLLKNQPKRLKKEVTT